MKRKDATCRTTYVVTSVTYPGFAGEYFGTRGEAMHFAALDLAELLGVERVTFTGAKLRARQRGRSLADILTHGNALNFKLGSLLSDQ